jgi:dihydropyrimidinase
VVYDPAASHTISASTHHMSVDYSAYEGRQVRGKVEVVLSRGQVVVDPDGYHGEEGHGRFLTRGACQLLQ